MTIEGKGNGNDSIIDTNVIHNPITKFDESGNPIAPDVKLDDDGKPIVEDTSVISPLLEGIENETLGALDDASLKTILESKGGIGFDKDGSIVDATGKVVVAFDDYKDDLVEDEVDLTDIEELEIEGTSYKLDKDGNAVDATGKIFKTKDEVVTLIKENDESGDDNIINSISEISGFKATDKEGNVLEFEESADGMAKREAHIVKQYGTELASQEIDTFFNANPDIVELYNYKRIHGTLDGFKDRVDYGKIEVAEDNDDQQKEIIISSEMLRGRSRESAESIANYMIEDGKGKAEADIALNHLKDEQVKKDRDAVATNKAKKDAASAATVKEHQDIAKIIKSGKVGDVIIPEYIKYKRTDGSIVNVSRDFIYDYMTKPTSNGKSQMDIDNESKDLSQNVLGAYMALTGFDYSDIVKSRERQSNVNKLRNIKSRSNLGNKVVIKKRQTIIKKGNEEIVG